MPDNSIGQNLADKMLEKWAKVEVSFVKYVKFSTLIISINAHFKYCQYHLTKLAYHQHWPLPAFDNICAMR